MLPTIAIWLIGTLVAKLWDREDLGAALYGLLVNRNIPPFLLAFRAYPFQLILQGFQVLGKQLYHLP